MRLGAPAARGAAMEDSATDAPRAPVVGRSAIAAVRVPAPHPKLTVVGSLNDAVAAGASRCTGAGV